MKRLLLCCFLLLTVGSIMSQTREIEKLKKENVNLKRQISQSETLLRTTKKDTRAQLAALTLVNAQISEKEKFISKVKKDAEILQRNINKLELQLKVLEHDLLQCKRKYKHALMFVFNHKLTHSKWLFVLSSKDFRTMTRRLRYASQYAKYQHFQGEEIKRKEDTIRTKRSIVKQRKRDKERLLAESKRQAEQLKAKKEQQQKLVTELNKKQSTLRLRLSQQRRKQQQLNNKIDRLIRIEIAAAEKRRKEREARERAAEQERLRKLQAEGKLPKGKVSKKSNVKWRKAKDADRELSGSFTQNRGKLSMPVTGAYAITAHFGAYNVSGLKNVRLDNKGIDICARRGASARSVFRGEVTAIFTFGRLYNIIVRHGSYLSVYCNLLNVCVKKGQKVKERQRLGTIATDASGNATLHFQLRKETSRLNPERWLK